MSEERRKPKKDDAFTNQPTSLKPIVSNPSTPGVQPPNKPDGRDAPPQDTERR